MAQLGEDRAADKLLARAERGLVTHKARALEGRAGLEAPLHARVLAARGEIALAERDLVRAGRLLEAAEIALGDDWINRTFVRLLRVRLLILSGNVDDARALATMNLRGAPPRLIVIAELLRADIAARRFHVLEAEAALVRARAAARASQLRPLMEQVEALATTLAAPVARIDGEPANLGQIAALSRSKALVIDGCKREIRRGAKSVPLATRAVLFDLARALGESHTSRAELLEQAFGAKRTTDSLRARLRVEIGRLRRLLAPLGVNIEPTPEGFALDTPAIVVLPPADGEASLLLALLRSGEAWSSSALSTASGLGQRAVQRALGELKDAGKIDSHGAGKNRRWVAVPPEGFATTLLLTIRPPAR